MQYLGSLDGRREADKFPDADALFLVFCLAVKATSSFFFLLKLDTTDRFTDHTCYYYYIKHGKKSPEERRNYSRNRNSQSIAGKGTMENSGSENKEKVADSHAKRKKKTR